MSHNRKGSLSPAFGKPSIRTPWFVIVCRCDDETRPAERIEFETAPDETSEGKPIHWTGREVDADIDLQYNRARYCDPTVGRWISDDPLGYESADDNLYPYPSDCEGNADRLHQ